MSSITLALFCYFSNFVLSTWLTMVKLNVFGKKGRVWDRERSKLNSSSIWPLFMCPFSFWSSPVEFACLLYFNYAILNVVTCNYLQFGHHGMPRVGSRFGKGYIDIINILSLTLPGVSIVYQGERPINNPCSNAYSALPFTSSSVVLWAPFNKNTLDDKAVG